MDDDFAVGDKIVLTYFSKFGTGRKAVLNGEVKYLGDDGLSVKIGVREDFVKWDDVLAVRLA